MITRPFNFDSHLSRPSTRLEAAAFINVVLLVLFFDLLDSRFVLAPGIPLRLPVTDRAPLEAIPTSRVLTVSAVEGSEMLFFDNMPLTLETFARHLAGRKGEFANEVLLIRVDRDVTQGLMARVLNLARNAGFKDVHLATEAETAAPSSPLAIP